MALQPNELTIRIINSKRENASPNGGNNAAGQGGKAVDTAQNVINGTVVARELISIARQATSFVSTNVSITTGNNISQERIAFGVNAATKLAAYGAALATGNVVAAGIMAINDTINIITRSTQLGLQNQVERESLALSRDRAGIAFNQSRMGGAK